MQLLTPTTHPTDIPLGGYAYHHSAKVKIVGRERDKSGKVDRYFVADEAQKPTKRYYVEAVKLRVI